MIKAIIFDFDGVLFDSEPLHFAAGNTVLQELGFYLPHDIYKERYVGRTDRDIFQHFLAECGYQAKPEEIRTMIYKKMNLFKEMLQDYASLEAIAGAPAFLEQASKQTGKLAICSNANKPDLMLVLSKLEGGALQKYFQHIITLDDVKEGKPAPEGYLKAAGHLVISPENCLVIEDSQGGIKAGKSAGMTVFGLTTSHAAPRLKEADHIAESYADIGLWLSRNLAF